MNLDKFLGCIYGVAIGDALGRPVETMTANGIRNSFGRIEKYESFHDHFTGARYKRGTWSDDTQLTLALMKALIDSGGNFDMDVIANGHIREFKEAGGRGWGPSTFKSCKKLSENTHWLESGNPNGAGNGVMMKIAPLGLWRSVLSEDPRIFSDQCVTFAKMTHLGTPAIVGGVVHAFAVVSLAGRNNRKVEPLTLLRILYNLSVFLEDELECNLPTDKRWSPEDQISKTILDVVDYLDLGKYGNEDPHDLERLALKFFGGTSYAPRSFGLSYAIFMKSCLNPDNPDPFSAVFDAVNAGGDTDSNAAIVGSLVGALHGFEKAIPKELARDVEGSEEIRKLTTRFYDVCKQRRQL